MATPCHTNESVNNLTTCYLLWGNRYAFALTTKFKIAQYAPFPDLKSGKKIFILSMFKIRGRWGQTQLSGLTHHTH